MQDFWKCSAQLHLRTWIMKEEQAAPDIFWVCGDGQLRQKLPKRWTGLSAYVMMASDVLIAIYPFGEEAQSLLQVT